MLGLQAEIADTPDDIGGLYETGGRAWIARPLKNDEPKKATDKSKEGTGNDWSELAVAALGDRIVVQVDGRTTAKIRDDKGREKGHIALQLHGGQDMDVEFTDVEVLTLSEKKCPE